MEKSIGATLAELRRGLGLMQKDVAARLGDYGFTVSAKTVYNWEKGVSQPGVRQFLALCDILRVDDPLWQFMGIHKGPYAGLNDEGRKKAREHIGLLMCIEALRDEPEPEDTPRLLRLYDIPVSAGTGNFLDDSDFELIEAPAYVPQGVDFALRISGDSMEPLYQDGQIVWIRERETLEHGEIGIFYYSGGVYCKKLMLSGGGAALRSLNPAYEDIEICEDMGFRVIGRVVA